MIRHDLSTTVLNKCSVQPAYAQGLIPQVVQARFRQAGMRWSEAGARRLLALRLLLRNDQWALLDGLPMVTMA